MKRRDTIIVAVLVNTGLLIILFASALKSSDTPELASAQAPAAPQQKQELVFAPVKAPPAPVDEVDQALQSFVAAPALPPAPAVTNFVEDLKLTSEPEIKQAPAFSSQTLTAAIPAPVKAGPDFIEIKVKKGDVLEKLARHHHCTVAEIMKINQLSSTNLRIGQVLKIPNKTLSQVQTQTVAHAETKYYIVKKGDSPWTIAMKHHLKVEDLLKLNQMSEEQARRLKPGDQLRIR